MYKETISFQMVGWYLHFTQERFLIVLQLENRTSLVIFMTYGTTLFFCQWLLCELSGSDFHGTLSLFGLLIISSALSSTSCRLRSLRIHGEQAGFHLMYSKIAVEEICTALLSYDFFSCCFSSFIEASSTKVG